MATDLVLGYCILGVRIGLAVAAYLSSLVPLLVWWRIGFEASVVIGIGLVLLMLVRITERLELNRQALERQS